MRVLLASAPHADTFGYSMPPPGLLRLGGALQHAFGDGRDTSVEVRAEDLAPVEVRVEDLAFRLAQGALPHGDGLCDAAAELLLAHTPDLLGLSTMGATLPAALAIAERVRAARPATRIVLGGPGATGIDQELVRRFAAVDAVVRGEGEETFVELVGRMARAGTLDADGVRGVTWDAGGRARREEDRPPLFDLDRLPPYAWNLVAPIAEYKAVTGEDEGLVPLDSGRGCVYDCSFCTIGRFWSRRSRPLPVARLVREIQSLASIPGARRAYLCHDLFAADREHALALCDALEAARCQVPWEVRARVDHLDDELIERMGAAGCYRVLLGVESADHAVRERHQKRMRSDVDVVHVVERLADAGITPILSLILGLPGEGDDELEATLMLALESSLAAGCNLSFHLVNPQPGCGLGETHAASSEPVPDIPPDMALGAGTTAPERALIDAHPDLFSTFAVLTGEAGGVARLRELHALATLLPDVLMSRPRSFAHVARASGLGVRGTYERWRAHAGAGAGTGSGTGLLADPDVGAAAGDPATSFDAFAASLDDPALDDLVRWEQAIDRAPDHELGEFELVSARYDLPGLARRLRSIEAGPADERPTTLAVVRGARGVRTLAISADVARLLETPTESLASDQRALLASRGLLRPVQKR